MTGSRERGGQDLKNNLSASEPSSYSWNKGDKFAMKTVNQILGENQALRGALRVLTGETNSGKRAIYISGNPAGFRLLAEILQAQADSVGSGGGESRYFFKLERDSGSLFFATDDSVEVFEIHCEDHFPEKHETSAYRRKT
jgi:hypothetical protein